MLDTFEMLFRVLEYLLRIVESYLSDREFLYDTSDGLCRRESQVLFRFDLGSGYV